MDIISFNEAATANSRIEKFIENPDSTSGIVTVPKTIASGETVTVPAGRVAVLPNVQIDGVLNVEGEVFIPSGATLSSVVEKVTSTDNAVVRFDGTTGQVQNSGVVIDDNGNVNMNNSTTNTFTAYGISGANKGYIGDSNWLFGGSTNDFGIRATNNLVFGIGATERMRIDSAGRVIMPYQPSFYAHTISNNNVASGSYIKFSGTRHNIGGAYDTSTGRFTAPVKGVYHFNFSGITHDVSNYFYVGFAVNGSTIQSSSVHLPVTEGEYSNLCTTCTLLLYANDFVNVVVGFNGGSPYFEVGRSHFSGHLIG